MENPFVDAIKNGFVNYVNFSGRSSRSQFWYWYLFIFLVSVILSFFSGIGSSLLGDHLSGGSGISSIVTLALYVPTLSNAARRLRDAGKNPWWVLLYPLTTVFIIVGIIFFAIAFITQINFSGSSNHTVGLVLVLLGLASLILALVSIIRLIVLLTTPSINGNKAPVSEQFGYAPNYSESVDNSGITNPSFPIGYTPPIETPPEQDNLR